MGDALGGYRFDVAFVDASIVVLERACRGPPGRRPLWRQPAPRPEARPSIVRFSTLTPVERSLKAPGKSSSNHRRLDSLALVSSQPDRRLARTGRNRELIPGGLGTWWRRSSEAPLAAIAITIHRMDAAARWRESDPSLETIPVSRPSGPLEGEPTWPYVGPPPPTSRRNRHRRHGVPGRSGSCPRGSPSVRPEDD